MFKRNITLIQRRCPSAFRGVLNDKGEVVACFLWTPSPYHKISPCDMIKAGIWQIPYRFGIPTLLCLTKVVEWLDEMEERFYEANAAFCMLERMVVRPEYQGKGIDSKCLKSSMLVAPSEASLNVRLYQRLGYTVVGEVDFQDDDDTAFAFHSWFMSQQPTEVAKS
jgi:GNAT superfamily N-acetyltransferase